MSNSSEQLRILAIFQYIVGGLQILISCLWLCQLSIVISIFCHNAALSPAHGEGAISMLLVLVGGGFVFLGFALGILTALSGRYIALRVKRTYSIVMGGINCVIFPFGTILGIFTLILLTRTDVRQEYGEVQPPPVS